MVIATDHRAVDYGVIAAHAPIIIDTRNAMKSVAEEIRGRWVKA